MNYEQLFGLIKKKRSFLCVGLDSDLDKLPLHLKSDPDGLFTFNKAIVDATFDYAVSYKPNLAFYEALGTSGWESLERIITYIRSKGEIFIIADAKRGDIGNTSARYAEAFFNRLDVDAVTLSPYMGYDTVSPFLEFKDKWTVLLALTSNKSANDFQYFQNVEGTRLFEKVLSESKNWGSLSQMMYVVGATRAEELQAVRQIIPDHFLLVPGVGAQGGSLEEVARYGMNSHCGLLVNSSRGILYASSADDFAEKTGEKAKEMQQEMERLLIENNLV
ncbi:MAG: orotidine-5'-phosphate decarboxylase [Bacteroidales bacterium]|nr:orotidine-5'-phosphate decarboxylase [Bacteroidales bacterium]